MVIAKVTRTVYINDESIKIVEGVKYSENFIAYKKFPAFFEKVNDKEMLYGDPVKVDSYIKKEPENTEEDSEKISEETK